MQATFDPNAIAALLHRAPYHVDALLAMYDLYRRKYTCSRALCLARHCISCLVACECLS